jgi:putative spermidine/putrescine transport system ATP-binding protein
VEARGVHVRYDETDVVRDVHLTVLPGEIVSLLGPSGCGKTTTLRAIAGFVVPDRGDIFVDGRRVTEVPPHRRDVGMVFQGYALFPHLSVFDNVAYGLRMRRVPRANIAERVERTLSLVKLRDYANRRPRQLSGGQQQRVAIARALVIDPKVLLLDEPLSNLDAKLRQEMRVEMRRLLKSADTASIFVTHDQEEAMVISDRIVLMNHGEIVQHGSPFEIYHRPRSLFAAAFVGQANFLRGTVADVADEGLATVIVEGLPFRGIACGSLSSGSAATLVVKHERVRPVSNGAAGAGNAVECALESLSFTGANVQTHCGFGNQHIVSLTLAPSQDTSAAQPGTRVRLAWEHADTLIFPEEKAGAA